VRQRQGPVAALQSQYSGVALGSRIKIFDEFVVLIGYHRKPANRLLRQTASATKGNLAYIDESFPSAELMKSSRVTQVRLHKSMKLKIARSPSHTQQSVQYRINRLRTYPEVSSSCRSKFELDR